MTPSSLVRKKPYIKVTAALKRESKIKHRQTKVIKSLFTGS